MDQHKPRNEPLHLAGESILYFRKDGGPCKTVQPKLRLYPKQARQQLEADRFQSHCAKDNEDKDSINRPMVGVDSVDDLDKSFSPCPILPKCGR